LAFNIWKLRLFLKRSLWLNFKHVTYIKLQCYTDTKVKSLEARHVITPPVNIHHQYLGIWCHSKISLLCLLVHTTLPSFRLLFIITIKGTRWQNLTGVLHLPYWWHATHLFTFAYFRVLHFFNDWIRVYYVRECIKVLVILFLLVSLTFARFNYFNFEMKCSVHIAELSIVCTWVFDFGFVLVWIQTVVH